MAGVNSSPIRIPDQQALLNLVQRSSKSYLLIGSGPRLQYADPEKAIRETVHLLKRDDREESLILFGGDHADDMNPDLGYLVRGVKRILSPKVRIVSVQSWEEYDPFIDYIYYYPQTFTDKTMNKEIWGGVIGGEPVAATAHYLSLKMQTSLSGVVCIGGGRIAQQEFAYALNVGLTESHYIEAAPKYPRR